MTSRTARVLGNWVVITICVSLVMSCVAASAGSYKDRDGAEHRWLIDAAHSLSWDGEAYIPFGAQFTPKYLSTAQSDENLATDKAQIVALKTAGVTDVLLKPGKPMDVIPAEVLQKVIDLLEENGMTYGLEPIGAEIPFSGGFLAQPAVNRVPGIRAHGDVERNVGTAVGAFCVVCDARTGEIRADGYTRAKGGSISVPVKPRSDSDSVLVYYPELPVAVPDVWTGYDRLRDGILGALSHVKLGKGFRFIIDPLRVNAILSGEGADVFPTSTGFRLDYAAWLSRKYSSPRNLALAWGLNDHELADYREAAGLIPLWRKDKGVGAVYDSVSGNRYDVNAQVSAIWADFTSFRALSLASYMNMMADVIKRTVADVPIVYTACDLDQTFAATPKTLFDGVATPGLTGEDLALRAGMTFSIADSSRRLLWVLGHVNGGVSGYANKESLFDDMNSVRLLGAKGFIVDSAQDAGNGAGWVAEYAATNKRDKGLATYMPSVVYYTPGVSSASTRKMGSGKYWLPTLRPSKRLDLGDTMDGYVFSDEPAADAAAFIWSTKGKQVIHVVSDKPVTITDAAGVSQTLKPDKKKVAIPLTEDPISVVGVPAAGFLPIEMVESAAARFAGVVARAQSRKMATGPYEAKLESVKAWMKKGMYSAALGMARMASDELERRLLGVESTTIVEPSDAVESLDGSEGLPR